MHAENFRITSKGIIIPRGQTSLDELLHGLRTQEGFEIDSRFEELAGSIKNTIKILLSQGGIITPSGAISFGIDSKIPKGITIYPDTISQLGYEIKKGSDNSTQVLFFTQGKDNQFSLVKQLPLAVAQHIQMTYEENQVQKPRLSSMALSTHILMDLASLGKIQK